MLTAHRIVTGPWKENCYIVWGETKNALIIDPGDDFPVIEQYVTDHQLTVLAILNTHAHYDHLGAVQDCKERYSAPFYLHRADNKLLRAANFYRQLFLGEQVIRIPEVDADLAENPVLEFADFSVEVIHTPGHTPGGVCFWINGQVLITGDTVMSKSIGRTDLPGGSRAELLGSIDGLFARFADETVIHPGHGSSEPIGTVKRINSELQGAA